jgi:putative glutamine amidotransferase
VNRPGAPRIAITVSDPSRSADAALAVEKQQRYAVAVARHGAEPVIVHSGLAAHDRADALATMDGLLLSGGRDIDPARYGRSRHPSETVETDRDALEADAWATAAERALPVVGVCRGLQAINVFSGGTILQHVDGHAGPGWGTGPAATHPLRLVAGTRLWDVLGAPDSLLVNAYHHQGILEQDLAPGLRAAAWADSSAGPLVEGLEATDGRFVMGVQCHPERTESTPVEFERLFAAFVAAAAARAADPARG